MERLKGDIRSMITHISGLPGTPSLDQLVHKVTSLSEAIQKDAQGLPKRILEIVRDCFSDMGWDIKRKRVTQREKFSVAGLLAALHELLNEVSNFSPPVEPTAEELGSLSLACARLWDLDTNRLVPGKDYVIDLQMGKRIYDVEDTAARPLFRFVDEACLERPTYKSFVKIFDNYVAELGKQEVVTDEEVAENMVRLNLFFLSILFLQVISLPL